MYGRNGVASCLITTASGTATHFIQAWDGSNILASDTIASSTSPVRSSVNFPIPTSGSLSLRIYANANEPGIAIDDCYVGPSEGFNLGGTLQVTDWTSFTPTGTWSTNTTYTGRWKRVGDTAHVVMRATVSGAPDAVTFDFNFPTSIGAIDTTKVLGSSGTAGQRVGNATWMDSSGGTGQQKIPGIAILQSATTIRPATLDDDGASNHFVREITASLPITQATGDYVEITIEVPIVGWAGTSQSLTSDIVAWNVDANISGANISLGTSAQTAYITPNNGSLTLTTNSGSNAVGISCSSTNDNASLASTCSAGSEEPGITTVLPRAGTVEWCFDFSHNIVTGVTGVLDATFEVVETANASQTIATEGKSRIQSGLDTAATTVSHPVQVCGRILHSSSGRKTIRLMYEQSVTATITTNQLWADAGANNGQRDIHVTARYVDQQTPAPLLVNSVVSPSNGVERIGRLYVTNSGTPTIASQSGSWISSLTDNATGDTTVNFTAGTFSSAPSCVCQVEEASVSTMMCIPTGASTTSSIRLKTNTAAGTALDKNFNLICIGPK